MIKFKAFDTYWFLLLASYFLISCGNAEQGPKTKPYILATTGIVADMVRAIGQDSVTVQALMGPGVDPHLYKATQGDLGKMRKADIIFYNGLRLEGKMGEILEKLNRTKAVIALADGVYEDNLLESPTYAGAYDPHIWFDIELWKGGIPIVLDELISQDPESAPYFEQNAMAYSLKLDSLHEEVSQAIASIPETRRILITAHDAFNYFGRAYEIQVRGLQGISTLSEFGLKDRTNLVEYIVENEIPAVFVESSVSKKNIESIVEGCALRGHTVQIGGSLYSDALGAEGTEEGTYIGAFRANVKQIVNALKP